MIMPKGYKMLKTRVPGILEDAENDLPYSARLALSIYFKVASKSETEYTCVHCLGYFLITRVYLIGSPYTV